MIRAYFRVNDGFDDEETRAIELTKEEARGIAKLVVAGVSIRGSVTFYVIKDEHPYAEHISPEAMLS